MNRRFAQLPMLIGVLLMVAIGAGSLWYVQFVSESEINPDGIPVIVEETSAELSDKYDGFLILQRECAKGDETIYEISASSGYGGGEVFIFSDRGKELYHGTFRNSPNDGPGILVSAKGTKPNLAEYDCSVNRMAE
jgi:hypothetical protein